MTDRIYLANPPGRGGEIIGEIIPAGQLAWRDGTRTTEDYVILHSGRADTVPLASVLFDRVRISQAEYDTRRAAEAAAREREYANLPKGTHGVHNRPTRKQRLDDRDDENDHWRGGE